MDTEEMYQRGVADAERGDPHPFYYQHYYHYRRGYDRTRRRLGRPGIGYGVRGRRALLLAAGVLVVVVAAVVIFRGRAPATTARLAAEPVTALPSAPVPTRTPLFPTPTPTPSPTAASTQLRVGGQAQVANTGGNNLRGRKAPKLSAAPTAAFKEGEQVTILEGPVDADGYTWWRVEGKGGTGWSAQQSKEGVVWLQPIS
jgi:hypothetical protein